MSNMPIAIIIANVYSVFIIYQALYVHYLIFRKLYDFGNVIKLILQIKKVTM